MRYSQFEALMFGAGSVIVLGNILFALPDARVTEEVIAQVLILVVLGAALHWGRRGGLIAAMVASVVYTLMRIPLAASLGGFDNAILSLIIVRMLTYGIVGVLGGEVFGRIKYVFARFESTSGIDDLSGVYNEPRLARALDVTMGQYTRYGTPFSLVVVRLTQGGGTAERAAGAQARRFVRDAADHIRNDVRMVDETGRLDDGRFVVVLPQTPEAGGQVVAERLQRGLAASLGTRAAEVETHVIALPADPDAFSALRGGLRDASEIEATPQR